MLYGEGDKNKQNNGFLQIDVGTQFIPPHPYTKPQLFFLPHRISLPL